MREIAQVTLNRKDLGIAWKKPFTISLREAARPGPSELRIAVTKLWPNRLIGDQQLPPEKRKTGTNIKKWRSDSPLLPSGLFRSSALDIELSGGAQDTLKIAIIRTANVMVESNCAVTGACPYWSSTQVFA